MSHILVAESLHRPTLDDFINSHGAVLHEVPLKDRVEDSKLHFYYQPDITVEDLEQVISFYDGLVVRPKQVTTQAINNAEYLKLIVRGGAGVNSIDCDAAKNHGIIVENTPGQNSIATAEFAFLAMMQLLARRPIERSCKDVMSLSNEELLALQPEPYMGHELYGKSIAIIGLGNIGQAMAFRAKAFGMRVKSYSGSFGKGRIDGRVIKLGIDQVLSLEEACSNVDVISLHAPLTDVSNAMINDRVFNVMKEGTILINTARPQLIDVKSFKKAVERLGGVAIDGDPDVIKPFLDVVKLYPDVPNIITHHIADCTYEAQSNIAQQVLQQVHAYFSTGEIINQV